jgi:hypothetical protein
MDLHTFEARLHVYRRARSEQAEQAVIDDAWSDLLTTAMSLRWPSPSESSREVAAAYAVRDARAAKNAARDFDAIDQAADDWVEALEQFHEVVTLPD